MRIVTSVLVSFLIMGVSLVSWAESTPPGFDAVKWQHLVDTVVKSGSPMDFEGGQFRTLSHIVPTDTTQSHQAEYFSTVGVVSNGQYFPQWISVVSENWKINTESNWDIDQWIYQVSPDGALLRLAHNHLVEARDSQVLADDAIATGGADDPAELQHWGQKLNEWYSALPSTDRVSLP